MPTHSRIALATLAIAVTITACTARESDSTDSAAASLDSATTAAAAPNVVTVTATDYAFDAPAEIPAGVTTFRLVNRGPELHHVQLVKLNDGKTMDDLSALLQQPPQGPPPAWVEEVGGPNTPVPGGESTVTLDLEPGNYAMLCFIPSPDGKPHIAKGMVKPLTVTPAASAAREPDADVTMKLVDYDFELSQPITAGRHTIRVENAGPQPHEVFIAKLEPGKKASDLLAWVEKQNGPPPGQPLGGTTTFVTGTHQFITADFTPGTYALICFVPDEKDGKPHFVHGMAKEITVLSDYQ
ncbi:MAG TPA: hypothetical protein VJ820_15795 [Propionibacteriaceae bacterium]|nr:hypothetical protein [Propionibacteriaceae bacterium]